MSSLAAAFPTVFTYGLWSGWRLSVIPLEMEARKNVLYRLACTWDSQLWFKVCVYCRFFVLSFQLKGPRLLEALQKAQLIRCLFFESVYNVAILHTVPCNYTIVRSAGIDSEESILLACVAGVDHNLTLCPLHGQPHARVEHNPIRESAISLSQGLWIWPLRVSERSIC